MRISDWSSDVCSSDLTPHALGRMQIFEPKPIETEEVLLYEQDGGYKLIPATERGAPWIQQIRRQGRIRALSTVALRKQDTLRAGELMGVAPVALPARIRPATAQPTTGAPRGPPNQDQA